MPLNTRARRSRQQGDSFTDPASVGYEIYGLSPYGQILTPKPYSYIPFVFTMEYNNAGYPVGKNIQ